MQRRPGWLQCLLVAGYLFATGLASGAERAKLTIGYSSTGPTGVGLWVAKDIGAYGKYGLDPNLVFIFAFVG